MDKNVQWSNELKIERTIAALKKNNMNGYLVHSKDELTNLIEELTNEGDTVSCGGSMTLFETGIIDYLREGRFNFIDRYKEGLTGSDIEDIYRKTFYSDVFFMSSNAITEKGELYNVDGTGNRVAALMYGPKKVIIVAGINKIVKDIDEAVKRNQAISGPVNCKRLNRNTPCTKLGFCADCNSPDRICNEYTVVKRQRDPERIHVIFINKELGY